MKATPTFAFTTGVALSGASPFQAALDELNDLFSSAEYTFESLWDRDNFTVYVDGEETSQYPDSITCDAGSSVRIEYHGDSGGFPCISCAGVEGYDLYGITSIDAPLPAMWLDEAGDFLAFDAGYSVGGAFIALIYLTVLSCPLTGYSTLQAVHEDVFVNFAGKTLTFTFSDASLSTGYELPYDAFSGCSSLTEVPEKVFACFGSGATSADSAFCGCSSLTEMPSGIFRYNGGLTDMDGCFEGCSSLTLGDLYLPSAEIETAATAFDGLAGIEGTVYVPEGSTTEETLSALTVTDADGEETDGLTLGAWEPGAALIDLPALSLYNGKLMELLDQRYAEKDSTATVTATAADVTTADDDDIDALFE